MSRRVPPWVAVTARPARVAVWNGRVGAPRRLCEDGAADIRRDTPAALPMQKNFGKLFRLPG